MTTESTPAPVTLNLDGLEREALAGEGNYLWKVPYKDDFIVIKVYFGSRSIFRHLKKSVGNLLLTGRTSHMPRARFRVEAECANLWKKHGFNIFPMHPEIRVEGLREGGYMVFDYVPGWHFRQYFKDEKVPLEERLAMWRRWVPEWHRRHATAIREVEPGLIHENGDVKHVMIWEDDFTYFDFEIRFRSKNILDLVGREMLAYMRSVGKFFGDEMYDRMTDILVEVYPDKSLLLAGWEHAYRNRNPIVRFGRWLDRKKKKHQHRYSKYSVATDIKRRLDEASLTT